MAAVANATAWPSTSGHHLAAPAQRRSSHTGTSTTSSHHSEAPRRSQQQQPHQQQYEDRFYGHRDIAELCERVIFALFSCPLDSAATSANDTAPAVRPAPRLSEFVAYALHRTRLPTIVTHHALFLLKRLKSRFPAARGSSGHRLFISALMLASKVECDDTYSNKSWTIVGQALFSLAEINQMERELFGYLGYRVNVQPEELQDFVQGLSQGRITAPPIQPPSPAMGVETLPTAPVTPSTHLAPRRVASSPSATSEHAYAPSPSHERPQRSDAAAAIRGRQHSAHAFSSRASISGYPSLASSIPMSASASDPALHHSNNDSTRLAPSISHPHDVRSPATAVAPCAPSGFRSVVAAPSVPMQGYHTPSSPMDAYSSPLSRGVSSDTFSYVPSPFGSRSSASSSHTSPETPASELCSPNWQPASAAMRRVTQHSNDDEDLYRDEAAGTYDSERKAFALHLQQQPTQSSHFRARTGESSTVGGYSHGVKSYPSSTYQQQQRVYNAWH